MVHASRIQRTQHRPSSINVIHAPAAIPTSLCGLRAAQVIDRTCHRRAVRRGFVDLCQHRNTAGGDVLGRRIEQCAMIGERDVVQIVVLVVGIERAPSRVVALHPQDPFVRRGDGCAEVIL